MLPHELQALSYVMMPVCNTARIDPHASATVIKADMFELTLPPGALSKADIGPGSNIRSIR